ncbi:MAG: BON domain-containing protein, partial [Alphaproteobacteria bacterium]
MTALPPKLVRFASLLLLTAWAVGTAGCSVAGMAIGAGAGTAVAASEERGLGGAINDTTIRTKINYELLDADISLFRRVSTSVHEGRVLLMGIVPNEEAMTNAVKIVWKVEGVREVINELRVAPDAEFT